MRWDNERRGQGQYRNQQYRDRNRGNYGERGWLDKTADEVSSWLGDEEAARRRERDARNQQQNYGQNYSSQNYGGQFIPYDDEPRGYTAGYTPTEPSPYYPMTNKIYDHRDENTGQGNYNRQPRQQRQNFQSQQSSNYSNQQRSSGARARDLMSSNVVTIHPNDTVQHAARLMRDSDCGAIPVVDWQGRMIGMVTDRNITVRIVASGSDIRNAQVQDCMTDEVFACHENDSIQSCIDSMKRHQIRRLVVVDNQNRVMGIISQGDIAQYAQRNRREHDDFTNLVGEISESSYGAYR